MADTNVTNLYEAEARMRKAQLIHAAVDASVRPEHLAVWDRGQRARIARSVGKDPPSDATWELVVQLRMAVAAVQARQPDDPFQGLPR